MEFYRKYKAEEPVGSQNQRAINWHTYNLSLVSYLICGQISIFACDKIEDINNFIGDGQNRIIINFEINNTNCDIFYDFLMSLKKTSDILIKYCSSITIIENISKMGDFIPNLITIQSSDSGCIYECLDLEEKNLNIRNKNCKNANK